MNSEKSVFGGGKKKMGILILFVFAVLLTSCTLFDKVEEMGISEEVAIDNKDIDISKEEQEFNDSGQAKAIEDETDLWQVFEDNEVGIDLRFPLDVGMSIMHEHLLKLEVDITPIAELEGTMGFDKETALKNIEYLSMGNYGVDVDWPLIKSKTVRKLGNINAQEFMVLSRFEVCDVTFEKKLYFFHNDNQIVVSLIAGKNRIMEEGLEYFKMDEANCGDGLVWDLDKQVKFYDDLKNGQGSEFATRWLEAFDSIVDTINITKSESSSDEDLDLITRLDLLQGK